MGSYAMKDGVHDFNADETNDMCVTHTFEGSGVKAGVQDGLGFVENLVLGATQAQQKTHSNIFRQESSEEAVGGGKNGKSFNIKY